MDVTQRRGLLQQGCGIGIAGAGIVAGTLIDLFGWRAAFILPGVVCLLTGLGLLVCLRLGLVEEGAPPRAADPPPSRSDMLRVFAILLLTMFFMGLIFQGTQAALPKVFDLRLRDIAGEGAFGIGLILAGVYTVGGIMQIVGGYLADRYPLKPIYICVYLFQVPVLATLAGVSGLPLIAVAMLIVLLSTVGLPAENMLLARYTPMRHHSLVFGVKFVLSFGAAPLAIAFAAFVQERSGEFTWLFLSLAGLAAAAMLAALLLPAEGERGVAPLAAE